jgi:hypothetical protein
MGIEDWETRPDGQIALGPLTGWQTAAAPMTGVLRLESARSEDQLRSGERAVLQLAMTALQCRQLAQALIGLAENIEAQPKGAPQ